MGWKKRIIDYLFPADDSRMKVEPAVIKKYQHFPDRLFKFYRADPGSYGFENVRKDQIWLSLPEKMNDPFDSSLTFSTEAFGHEVVRKRIDQIMHYAGEEFEISEANRAAIEKVPDPVVELTKILAEQKNESPETASELAGLAVQCEY